MKRLTCLFLLFLCVQAQAQTDQEALTKELQNFIESSDIPGFAVCLVNSSGIVYQKGFGKADKAADIPFTPQTIHSIGSVTKTVVGVAISQLIEAGKITPNTPINEVLPFSINHPYYPEKPITIQHLITHTSGIADGKKYGNTYIPRKTDKARDRENLHLGYENFISSHESMSLSDFIQHTYTKGGKWYKKKNFQKTVPGSSHNYSNANAAIAGLIVEHISGQHFKEYAAQNIFDKLGMQYSGFDFNSAQADLYAECYFPSGYIVPNYQLITYADGGMMSNVEDLGKYLLEVIRGFGGQGTLMQKTGYQQLLPGDGDDQRAFWGMNEQTRNIGHTGSDPGVHCEIRFQADQQTGWVIMVNSNVEDHETLWNDYKKLREIVER